VSSLRADLHDASRRTSRSRQLLNASGWQRLNIICQQTGESQWALACQQMALPVK